MVLVHSNLYMKHVLRLSCLSRERSKIDTGGAHYAQLTWYDITERMYSYTLLLHFLYRNAKSLSIYFVSNMYFVSPFCPGLPCRDKWNSITGQVRIMAMKTKLYKYAFLLVSYYLHVYSLRFKVLLIQCISPWTDT